MTDSAATNNTPKVMPKLLLGLAVAYVGVAEYFDLSFPLEASLGIAILMAAVSMALSRRYAAQDKAWILAGVGIVIGTLISVIGHSVGD